MCTNNDEEVYLKDVEVFLNKALDAYLSLSIKTMDDLNNFSSDTKGLRYCLTQGLSTIREFRNLKA